MIRHHNLTTTVFALAALATAFPAASEEESSLDEISQELENPLSKLWSLTFQNNLGLNTGDVIDGTEISNTALFQPAFPIPFGDDWTFIARPVFPLVTTPILDPGSPSGVDRTTTGFGDIQMLSLIGPAGADGFVWGLGGTFKFPTASSDALGAGKWQAGPAAMALYLGEQWTTGLVFQHWLSFAGDSSRQDTNRTELQYIFRRKLPEAWTIGMGPTVVADWEQDLDNRFTVPIGLGITKTLRFGGTPVKVRFESQYSLIKSDDYGTTWNFRLQFTPVIKSPFSR
jgi:hypothetical protein